jgi:hypothetical protein
MHAPQSILAAPMTASLILLAVILLAIEIVRVISRATKGRARAAASAIDTSAIARAGN